MGSDDVRARAEAVALAYKNLRESISRWHGDGFAVSVNLGPLYESCDSLTAALAVAPATAQPVAWACRRRDGTFLTNDGGGIDTTDVADHVGWQRVADEAHPEDAPHTLVPLYAAPPATAQPGACVAHAPDNAPRVVVEPYGASRWQVWLHIGSASWAVGEARSAKDAADRFAEPLRHALATLSLPASDAMDAAGAAFYRAARGMFTHGSAWGGTHWTVARKALDALLAAEAADEGHTLAAKESRSDDRPAKGQGGGRG